MLHSLVRQLLRHYLQIALMGRVAVILLCLVPINGVIVVAKTGSLFIAVAISANVFKLAGALLTVLAIAFNTYAIGT